MAVSQLRPAANYIKLILETTKEQAKLLLSHPTVKQIEALSEIAFNLITISIPNDIKALIQRNKSFLVKLAKKTSSIKSKLRLLKANTLKLIRILLAIKESLLQLV